ncbi:MAG: hypothetical protein EXR02_00680 [Rhodospirillales bacterium]|nr:hypothetical protein [Rhodospirillales bacterium]MSP79572.1 hypothetical protein [Rhodospirillales bacterium]
MTVKAILIAFIDGIFKSSSRICRYQPNQTTCQRDANYSIYVHCHIPPYIASLYDRSWSIIENTKRQPRKEPRTAGDSIPSLFVVAHREDRRQLAVMAIEPLMPSLSKHEGKPRQCLWA